MFEYFIKGVVLGFYIAAPIGVISILYIRRSLQKGKLSGIVSAAGVTTAETFYAIVAIYGLSFISDFLIQWKFWLQLCGGIFMLVIGIKSIANPTKSMVKVNNKYDLVFDYFSIAFLSLLNPLAIIGFIVVFASIGAGDFNLEAYQSLTMVLGFACASFCYCLALILIASLVRKRFKTNDADLIKMLNQMSGVIIVLFTIAILSVALLKN